jgi:hypothetical protein
VASSVSAAPELTSMSAWLGLTVAAAVWAQCGGRPYRRSAWKDATVSHTQTAAPSTSTLDRS